MSNNYIKTPTTISLSTITTNDLTLSASQLVELVMPNKNYLYVGTFIKYYKISQLIHTQSIAN